MSTVRIEIEQAVVTELRVEELLDGQYATYIRIKVDGVLKPEQFAGLFAAQGAQDEAQARPEPSLPAPAPAATAPAPAPAAPAPAALPAATPSPRQVWRRHDDPRPFLDKLADKLEAEQRPGPFTTADIGELMRPLGWKGPAKGSFCNTTIRAALLGYPRATQTGAKRGTKYWFPRPPLEALKVLGEPTPKASPRSTGRSPAEIVKPGRRPQSDLRSASQLLPFLRPLVARLSGSFTTNQLRDMLLESGWKTSWSPGHQGRIFPLALQQLPGVTSVGSTSARRWLIGGEAGEKSAAAKVAEELRRTFLGTWLDYSTVGEWAEEAHVKTDDLVAAMLEAGAECKGSRYRFLKGGA